MTSNEADHRFYFGSDAKPQAIRAAVERGTTVYWKSDRYKVVQDWLGNFLILCDNGSAVGLTHSDGAFLNGRPEEFYIK